MADLLDSSGQTSNNRYLQKIRLQGESMSRLPKALRLSMMPFVIWDSVALSSSCGVHGKGKKISGVSWTVWDAGNHQVCLKNHRTRECCGLSGVITKKDVENSNTWCSRVFFLGTVILLCSGQFKVQTLKKKKKEDKEEEETKDNQERTRRSTRQEEGPNTNTNNKEKMRMRRSMRQRRITRKRRATRRRARRRTRRTN